MSTMSDEKKRLIESLRCRLALWSPLYDVGKVATSIVDMAEERAKHSLYSFAECLDATQDEVFKALSMAREVPKWARFPRQERDASTSVRLAKRCVHGHLNCDVCAWFDGYPEEYLDSLPPRKA